MQVLDNLHIVSSRLLPSPNEICGALPISAAAAAVVTRAREEIRNVLDGKDRRLLLIVGPCAIHDTEAGLEYAARLKGLAAEISDVFVPVMRVYFEKPRTTTGWKGLINDPHLNGSFDIEEGLAVARRFMLQVNELGMPAATEALDPVIPQYLSDLISWTAIGARTAESQTHREMASGLSSPVGFKNGTDGSLEVAINGVKAASVAHRFLGIDRSGRCSVFHTTGNRYGHVVLRGGKLPNYDAQTIARCEELLRAAGLPMRIMVDCSHGNSGKNPLLQEGVLYDCVNQLSAGNRSIIGVMIESNIKDGRQELGDNPAALEYGVSITDGCLGWEATAEMIRRARSTLRGAGFGQQR